MSLATIEAGFLNPNNRDPVEQFMDLLDPFFDAIDAVDERNALMALERGRRRFDAKRTRLISHRSAPDASQLLRQAGASKRDAKRTVERGKLINLHPELGDQFERGQVSAEKLDVIATADRATRGSASFDPDFVRDIVEASPDAIHKKKNAWINKQQSAAEVKRKYKFQRDNRDVFKHWLDDGRPVVSIADTRQTSRHSGESCQPKRIANIAKRADATCPPLNMRRPGNSAWPMPQCGCSPATPAVPERLLSCSRSTPNGFLRQTVGLSVSSLVLALFRATWSSKR